MLAIDRVLFPTDFSTTAEEALAQAAELARFLSAELFVLHVIQSLPADSPSDENASGFDDLFGTLEKEAHERVTALSEVPELVVHGAVRRADAVAPAILEYAREADADLIVMGTHGRRGLRKWIAGSVTQEVVREADRPVLTLRRREHGLDFESARSFLVPIDFSQSSLEALAYARELAGRTGASLDLLHVAERPVFPTFYPEAGAGAAMASTATHLTPLAARSRSELEALVTEVPGPDVRFEVHVAEGRPAARIVELSDEKTSDLIVMGSHGLSGLSHLLLGSVAETVMQRANRPVLIVRSRDAEGARGAGTIATSSGTAR